MRKWQRVSGRPGDLLPQRRVVQEGCVPGATDGSMPVGSGRVFMHLSIINITSLLSLPDLLPVTLCWLLGTSVRGKRWISRTDVPLEPVKLRINTIPYLLFVPSAMILITQ